MTTGLRRRISVSNASGAHLYDGWLLGYDTFRSEGSDRFFPIVICEEERDDRTRRLIYHTIHNHQINFIDNPEGKEEEGPSLQEELEKLAT